MKLALAKIIADAPEGSAVECNPGTIAKGTSPLLTSCLVETAEEDLIVRRYYATSGALIRIDYRLRMPNGDLPRYHNPSEGQPAVEGYYENGTIYYQEWWVSGRLHRPSLAGPALIEYNSLGLRRYCEYWENGSNIDFLDFD